MKGKNEQSGSARRILVIGELNVDLIASGLVEGPVLGKEIIAESLDAVLGSSSAIFSCGAAKLGNEVTFVSAVGDDDFGRFCLEALAKEGVSTKNVVELDGVKTGVTLVMSTPGDRALVTYRGAIAELSRKHIPADVFDGQDHLHLTSFYLQTGLQGAFADLFSAARSKGLTTSFDTNSDPENRGIESVRELLELTDILFLNNVEAKQLTGISDARSACAELGKLCPFVVLKLGPEGSIAFREGRFYESPGFRVSTIDTTGAGDSFAAGFVHGFLAGRETEVCLAIGNACGALSTRRSGGTAGQPDAGELERFLGEHRVKTAESK